MNKKKSLAWQNYSEEKLALELQSWCAGQDFSNTIVFLEGDMGAGKSTFVRALLHVLAPEVQSQGSPTFPIVQTYAGPSFPVYHIDLYRLKSPQELFDSGIEDVVSEDRALVCIEWASLFADQFAFWFEESAVRAKKVFLVTIASGADGSSRDITVSEF